jgi:hypothetical protein
MSRTPRTDALLPKRLQDHDDADYMALVNLARALELESGAPLGMWIQEALNERDTAFIVSAAVASVIAEYDDIIKRIPAETMAADGPEADFVIRVRDYLVLRDTASGLGGRLSYYIERAEAAGFDAGRNMPNAENCHVSLFGTLEETRAWERGKKRGDAERESGDQKRLTFTPPPSCPCSVTCIRERECSGMCPVRDRPSAGSAEGIAR